jgi:hypothetical protein
MNEKTTTTCWSADVEILINILFKFFVVIVVVVVIIIISILVNKHF